MIKDKIAKAIRVLSVPPIMISTLMIILYCGQRQIFSNIRELVLVIVFLGIVPILAYPLQKLLPSYRNTGRNGQRKLAFIATAIGYSMALLWAFFAGISSGLMLVVFTYFFSVLLLILANKGLHFKASGHASSFTGPLLILIYYWGWKAIIPCIITAGLISWSSIHLKRHTWKELLGGFMACLAAFGISLIILR